MISVGTATETALVRKKGKVLSSLYRIGINGIVQIAAARSWNKSLSDISNIVLERLAERVGTLNPNPHSEYSPRLFSYFFATVPTPVTYIYT